MPSSDSGIRAIIDTDVSIGIAQRDVDDGLALLMAHHSPKLTISAVTLTYGNSTLKKVCGAMSSINEYLRLPESIIKSGAESHTELGKKTDAVDCITSNLESQRHTLIALGPLTNIASVVKLRPDLVSQIEKVIMVAGRRPGHRFLTGNYPLSHPDLNFEKDPAAVNVLLETKLPIVFAPFELSSKIWITESILDRIKQTGTELGKYLYSACMPWLEMWRSRFSTELFPVVGFNPFDCLAIACVTDSDILTTERAEAVIEECAYDATDWKVQGTGVVPKPYLHVCADSMGIHEYGFEIVREEFLKRLIDRLV